MATAQDVLKKVYQSQNWKGECYECGVSAMISCHWAKVGDGLLLVQGEPINRGAVFGKRYGHCWLELGDEVYDLTIQSEPFPKVLYYAMGGLNEENVRRYNYDQVAKWCLDVKHYGPWEGPFGVGKVA